ncbi:sensor domain-containing diguanylate cyclase [Tepidibacter thalassicus]|uniref:PAS domain S-box-containing protein/diguanylate cyclase (GGDEF) domain-containing protein n=1 Tax=Tepidibacter thalassicus DSM 15285 TaxID=1123350 RepID=A0A1M5QG57_9FIRM|nr:diguanylate cyclase [Tepidibacter thalassicus]SHH13155.1 PAS domain S-box-containing protein/diguanylate cyclase (GGDEF) domain-containing protein [Tepidibacter thalassicus DSM 15285]
MVSLREDVKQKLSRELFLEIEFDCTIKDVTSNCYNILGYTKEEMIGQNIKEIFKNSELNKLLNKNDNSKIAEIIIKDKNNDDIYMSVKKGFVKEDNKNIMFLSMIDITKYKEKLNMAKRLMRIFEKSNDIIFSARIKPEIKFEYLSPAVYTNLGVTVEECKKNPLIPLEIVHPDEYEEHKKKFDGIIEDYSNKFYTRFMNKEGEYIWFEEYIVPVYDDNGDVVIVEGISRNIHERKQLEEKLRYLSYHDALTGLYNRAYFDKEKERLDKEINTSIGIIICDLDNLKSINDNLGHGEGDELIKLASKLIKKNVNENAVVARIGGDEFAILLKGVDYKEVENIVTKLKKTIKIYNSVNPEILIELSIGFAYSKNSIGCVKELFRNADKNMYIDKRKNKFADI